MTGTTVPTSPPLAKASKATLPAVQALVLTMECLGLSQSVLARRCKVTLRTVQRWLSGQHDLSPEALSNDAEIAMTWGARFTVVNADRVRKAA